MDSYQYQSILTHIRNKVARKVANNTYQKRPATQNTETYAVNLHTFLPERPIQIVYDRSFYINGYIVNNHGYRYFGLTTAFRTEDNVPINNYTSFAARYEYRDGFRTSPQMITPDILNSILGRIGRLTPGNNVRLGNEAADALDHQRMFVGFAEAVRFGDIISDIICERPLTQLQTRLDWQNRTNDGDGAVAVLCRE
ncbi:hypothetical protein ACMDCR_06310 [Labrys okinawensis]|uniref:hypothetical protein n=1 Tax=Labrys okinawensis TaxID=346911 RepID=UPI0039BCE420